MFTLPRSENQILGLIKYATKRLSARVSLSPFIQEQLKSVFFDHNINSLSALATMRKPALLLKQEAVVFPSEGINYQTIKNKHEFAHCCEFGPLIQDHKAIQANFAASKATNCHSVYFGQNQNGSYSETGSFDSFALALVLYEQLRWTKINELYEVAILINQIKLSLTSVIRIHEKYDEIIANSIASIVVYGVCHNYSPNEIERGIGLFLNTCFPYQPEMNQINQKSCSLLDESIALGNALMCLKKIKLGYAGEMNPFQSEKSVFRKFHNYSNSSSFFDLQIPNELVLPKIYKKLGCFSIEVAGAFYAVLSLLFKQKTNQYFLISQASQIRFSFHSKLKNSKAFVDDEKIETYYQAVNSVRFILELFLHKIEKNATPISTFETLSYLWELHFVNSYDIDAALIDSQLGNSKKKKIQIGFDDAEVNFEPVETLPCKVTMILNGFEFTSGLVRNPLGSPWNTEIDFRRFLNIKMNKIVDGEVSQALTVVNYQDRIEKGLKENQFEIFTIWKSYLKYKDK